MQKSDFTKKSSGVRPTTRSATKHYLFGHCGQMNLNQLPQCIDIIRFQYHLKGDKVAAPDEFFDDIISALKELFRNNI